MKVHSLPACVFSCSPRFLSGGYSCEERSEEANSSTFKLFFISITMIVYPAPVILFIFRCDAQPAQSEAKCSRFCSTLSNCVASIAIGLTLSLSKGRTLVRQQYYATFCPPPFDLCL